MERFTKGLFPKWYHDLFLHGYSKLETHFYCGYDLDDCKELTNKELTNKDDWDMDDMEWRQYSRYNSMRRKPNWSWLNALNDRDKVINTKASVRVVRYLNQYYSSSENYLGTFYFPEPESNVSLHFNEALYCKCKFEAAEILLLQIHDNELSDVVQRFIEEYPSYISYIRGQLRSDLMYSPPEIIDLCKSNLLTIAGCDDMVSQWIANTDRLKHLTTKRYCGETFGFYAIEDIFDQYLARLAPKLGYDIIWLYGMIGSHRICEEILDVRSHETSYEHLIINPDTIQVNHK